jgi:hypothetical protein
MRATATFGSGLKRPDYIRLNPNLKREIELFWFSFLFFSESFQTILFIRIQRFLLNLQESFELLAR